MISALRSLMKRSVGAASARWRSASAALLVIAALPVLNACSTQPPAGMTPVSPFQIERYLGKWYEIARLDHSFERGLSRVSADYSLQANGQVQVVNRGYDAASGRWREAVGKARFVESSDQGYLKVSFFGPFYGSYVIFELDQQDYQYAFVAGPNRDYLWLLARTPQVSPALRERFVAVARAHGFATEQLIWVEQP